MLRKLTSGQCLKSATEIRQASRDTLLRRRGPAEAPSSSPAPHTCTVRAAFGTWTDTRQPGLYCRVSRRRTGAWLLRPDPTASHHPLCLARPGVPFPPVTGKHTHTQHNTHDRAPVTKTVSHQHQAKPRDQPRTESSAINPHICGHLTLDHSARTVFSRNSAGTAKHPHTKEESGTPWITLSTEINSDWIKDLHVRGKLQNSYKNTRVRISVALD